MADTINPVVAAPVTAVEPTPAPVNKVKNKLSGVLGAIMVIALVAYSALTFYSMIRWNEATSGSLITGFVVLVTQLVSGFVRWMEAD